MKRLTISREAYEEAVQDIERLCAEMRARKRLSEEVIALIDKARSADPPLEYPVIYDLLVKKEVIDAEAIPTWKRMHRLYREGKQNNPL